MIINDGPQTRKLPYQFDFVGEIAHLPVVEDDVTVAPLKICNKLQELPLADHPWLSAINPPVGYQEVVYHTHECPLLNGQHLLHNIQVTYACN